MPLVFPFSKLVEFLRYASSAANALWVFQVQEAFLVVCRLIELIIQQNNREN